MTADRDLGLVDLGLGLADPDLAELDLASADPDLGLVEPDVALADPGLGWVEPDVALADPGLASGNSGLGLALHIRYSGLGSLDSVFLPVWCQWLSSAGVWCVSVLQVRVCSARGEVAPPVSAEVLSWSGKQALAASRVVPSVCAPPSRWTYQLV